MACSAACEWWPVDSLPTALQHSSSDVPGCCFLHYSLLTAGAATQDSAPSKAFLDRFSEHMSRAGRQLVAAHPIQHAESPDLEIVTRVHGPEPGYVATAILISQCAVTLLEERDLAPARFAWTWPHCIMVVALHETSNRFTNFAQEGSDNVLASR